MNDYEKSPNAVGDRLDVLMPLLRCPECRQGALERGASESLTCAHCGESFPVIEGLPFLFPAETLAGHVQRDEKTRQAGRVRITSKAGGRYHWGEYHIEELLRPLAADGKRLLLVGCGDAGEVPYLQQLGFDVAAFDIVRSLGTDFLADAHCLPIQDAEYDVVFSMQVLEHLHAPWIAASEISRVLKPGGWFGGSVAFLKPFHQSYFHMSYKGVEQLLAAYGLEMDKPAGAQSLSYTFCGTLMPLGSRRISRAVYGAFDQVLNAVRARLWSLRTGIAPDAPTERFDPQFQFSFKEYEKIRFAPAVVFRAQKK